MASTLRCTVCRFRNGREVVKGLRGCSSESAVGGSYLHRRSPTTKVSGQDDGGFAGSVIRSRVMEWHHRPQRWSSGRAVGEALLQSRLAAKRPCTRDDSRPGFTSICSWQTRLAQREANAALPPGPAYGKKVTGSIPVSRAVRSSRSPSAGENHLTGKPQWSLPSRTPPYAPSNGFVPNCVVVNTGWCAYSTLRGR